MSKWRRQTGRRLECGAFGGARLHRAGHRRAGGARHRQADGAHEHTCAARRTRQLSAGAQPAGTSCGLCVCLRTPHQLDGPTTGPLCRARRARHANRHTQARAKICFMIQLAARWRPKSVRTYSRSCTDLCGFQSAGSPSGSLTHARNRRRHPFSRTT